MKFKHLKIGDKFRHPKDEVRNSKAIWMKAEYLPLSVVNCVCVQDANWWRGTFGFTPDEDEIIFVDSVLNKQLMGSQLNGKAPNF